MKSTFQMEEKAIAPGTDDLDLIFSKFPDNSLVCLQRVVVCDLTTATKTASVGLVLGNDVIWLESLTLTTAARYYALTQPVWFTGVRKVIVRFHSPTASDKLTAYAYGYYME